MTIDVPGPLRNPLNGAYVHWSKHRRWARQWRERTTQRLLVHKLTTPSDAEFFRAPGRAKRVTFVCHVVRGFDDDALPAICKPLRDGLVDAQLLDDDAPDRGHVFTYSQRRIHEDGALERGVVITIEWRV